MGIIDILRSKKWLLYSVLVLVFLGIVYLVIPNRQGQAARDSDVVPNLGVFSGNIALDFTVKDGEGNDVSLSDFKGKPIFLNFFATWCGPCKVEMPYMEKIWREYQKNGSDLVYLVVDVGESKATVEKFFANNFFTMPVFYDANSRAFARYLFRGIPGSVFIDRDGIIRARYNESLPEATIRKNIELITSEI
ncbi:MAG: TlpA disulfide reductase family protein [Firmicutes bacterium]|nr:TlpA disulfide reductase family protein [Bacillota bacterium]